MDTSTQTLAGHTPNRINRFPQTVQPALCLAAGIWKWFGWIVAFLVPLAVYYHGLLDLWRRHADRMNTDAICYIRRAMYLAGGDFCHAISGYWSPLLSWCIAPFLSYGYGELYAARGVMLGWGAVLVIAFGVFLYSFSSFGHLLNMALMIAVALAIRLEAIREITPDVMLAACLLFYLSAASSKRLLHSRWRQALAGLLGGVSYLAKAYAFPFVLAHLALTYVVLGFVQRRDDKSALLPAARKAAGGWLTSAIAFAVIAGPWVGVLSWRYKHLTFSTTGKIAHALSPQKAQKQGHPRTLSLPPDPYIFEFENPETLPYRFWSPLGSRENFSLQLSVLGDNASAITKTVSVYDRCWLALIALCVWPLALLPFVQRKDQRWKTIWLGLTVGLYLSGYLLVFFIPRYINSLMLPLLLVLCIRLLTCWGSGQAEPHWGRRAANLLLGLAVVGAFILATLDDKLADPKQRNPGLYRFTARQVLRDGIEGPIASSNFKDGPYVAFHMGRKFVCLPSSGNPAAQSKRLRELGVAAIMVWDKEDDSGKEPRSLQIAKSGNWRSYKHYGKQGLGFELYVPAD